MLEEWLWRFGAGLAVAWIGTSVWELLKVWWTEAKQDFKCEEVGHEEMISNIKGWRGKP